MSLLCPWQLLSTVDSTCKAPVTANRMGSRDCRQRRVGSAAEARCAQLSSSLFLPGPLLLLPTLTLSCLCLGNQLLPINFSSLSPSHHTGDGRRALSFFHKKGLQDFDTLLLSGDENTLYVGAREAILALNIQDPGVPKLRNMVRMSGVGWESGGCQQLPCTGAACE